MFDSSVIDGTCRRVIVDSDDDRGVVADDRPVAPDDCTAWSSLKDHVIAVVACKVEIVDRFNYNDDSTPH